MGLARTHAVARALPAALAFAAGLVFGIGLLVSSLVDPARVLAFLDVAGRWDPSLMLTMGAAIAIGLAATAIAQRRTSTLIGLPLHLPRVTAIDRRLVLGGVVFGMGWGLAGICPGPSLVGLGMGSPQAALFVGAMLGGMALFDRAQAWADSRSFTSQRVGSPAPHHGRGARGPLEGRP